MTKPTQEHIEKIVNLGDFVDNSDAKNKIRIILECERQKAQDEILDEWIEYLEEQQLAYKRWYESENEIYKEKIEELRNRKDIK
jgi:DNA replicative helicase MCM subunit Mcm2 (Cdc46/Mcm family)